MGSQTQHQEGDDFDGLIEQIADMAEVLDVFDEGQDIALDLHTSPFSEETKKRTLAFLQSPRYQSAIQKHAHLTTGPVDLPKAGA